MTTTKQLNEKITQLTAKVAELKKQSDIVNPLNASLDEIVNYAQNEQQARENVAYLETVIEKLRSQLAETEAQEKAKTRIKKSKANFKSLVEQGDRVAETIELLEAEINKLSEIGKAIASEHMAVTGRLALDNRIDRDFRLPKLEKLENSIIIHTQARNYVGS